MNKVEKETLFVSFSGGRTSAYMCHWLINNKSDKYNFEFVFANTGLEHEETLKFVDRCDKDWGLNLAWIEAVTDQEKGSECRSRSVTFETASRNGEPFRELCAKFGIPNSGRPFCTQYLKTYPINYYKTTLGYKRNHKTAIGIRADEADRMNFKQLESGSVSYPLITMTHKTKPDIVSWFLDNDFDLELDSRLGNCVGCFKKSDRHLMTIAKIDKSYFNFFTEAEKEFGHIDAKENDPFRFFRGNRTASNIIASSEEPFREFDDSINEFQLSFDIDPLDQIDDCGSSCEA